MQNISRFLNNLLNQVIDLRHVVNPPGRLAGRHQCFLPVALIDGPNRRYLKFDQGHVHGGIVIRRTKEDAGRFPQGVFGVLGAPGGLQPPGGTDKTAGHKGPPVTERPQRPLSIPGGNHSPAWSGSGSPSGPHRRPKPGPQPGSCRRRNRPRPHTRRILVRYGLDHGGQQDHGVDRFPGGMEASFMAGGNDHIDAGLLATQSALNRGDNMHPSETGALDLVLPADRVASRGEDHFEVLLYIRSSLPAP